MMGGPDDLRFPYQPLDDSGVRGIHETTMRVLEEVGVLIPDKETGRVLSEAGACIDTEMDIARIPPEVVERMVAEAPSQITLCGMDESRDITVGDGSVHPGTGGTALKILERTGEARPATLDDLRKIARLVDSLDNIHFFLLPTYPCDLDPEVVDLNRFYAGLVNTGKHVMGGVYTEDGAMKVIRMAEEISGSAEALRKRPIVSMITCMISPLMPDSQYTRMMIAIAKKGIPVAVPAEPLCGATGPVTLAGNLVMQNADSLTGVVLTQAVNPGTPVLYGSVASTTNLRNMKYLCGSVEMGLLNAAGAQMARFYGLPYYATAGASDSKVVDAQSAYESAITALATALAGAGYIHDAAGLMEFAMTVSMEKYVVDNEILGMVMRAVRGIEVNEGTLAFDAIAVAGPGGNFVSRPHTRKYMRKEHYIPTISDRMDREDWLQAGGLDTPQRASAAVDSILTAEPRSYLSEVKKKAVCSMFDEIVKEEMA